MKDIELMDSTSQDAQTPTVKRGLKRKLILSMLLVGGSPTPHRFVNGLPPGYQGNS